MLNVKNIDVLGHVGDCQIPADCGRRDHHRLRQAVHRQIEHRQHGVTLPRGWAETLLRSGKLTVGTLPLDTGAAAWTNTHLSKFSCNEIHNSHVHIGLDDTKLIK